MKKYPHGFWEDGKNKYSVDELFDIVGGREPKNISIRKIIDKNKDLETKEGNFFDNIENPSKEFKGRAEKSDENYPILLSREGWIIDGSHRVAKLKWLGRRKISAHILSKKDLETAIVNIDESVIFGFEMWKKLTPIQNFNPGGSYNLGMTILIRPEEFEEGVLPKWRHGLLTSPSIDYATNTLNSWIGNEEVIVFRFKNYGFINDNRTNTYQISVGAAGIMLEITKT